MGEREPENRSTPDPVALLRDSIGRQITLQEAIKEEAERIRLERAKEEGGNEGGNA